jgi:hypothetical protein
MALREDLVALQKNQRAECDSHGGDSVEDPIPLEHDLAQVGGGGVVGTEDREGGEHDARENGGRDACLGPRIKGDCKGSGREAQEGGADNQQS